MYYRTKNNNDPLNFIHSYARRLSLTLSMLLGMFMISVCVSAADEAERTRDKQVPLLKKDGKKNKESKAETIKRCLKQLQSDQAAVRRQAVMILGKYQSAGDHRGFMIRGKDQFTVKARRAVIEALDDDAAEVRRAALVSLSEGRLIPPQAAPKILGMLDDPDVHIRRIASSLLRQIMLVYLDRPRAVATNNRPPPSYPQTIGTAIRQAFNDEDASVRENMLSHYQYFRNLITPKLIKPLLKTDKTNIKLLALKAAGGSLSAEAYVDVVKSFVEDKNPEVRLHLTRHIPVSPKEEVIDLCRRLSKDTDAEVATLAISKLLRLKAFSDWNKLKDLLKTPSLDTTIGLQAIRFLPLNGKNGVTILRHLLQESQRARFRAFALRVLGRLGSQDMRKYKVLPFLKKPTTRNNRHQNDGLEDLTSEISQRFHSPQLSLEDTMGFLSDPSKRVRSVAVELLENHDDFTLSRLQQLKDSSDVEVRKFVVTAATSLPDKKARKLLFQFLPDPNPEIRRKVIHLLARKKYQGWRRIVQRSLRDESAKVEKMAVRLLWTNQTSGTKKILRQHKERTENPEIRKLIERGLQ